MRKLNLYIAAILISIIYLPITNTARCNSHPKPGKPNPYPILDGPLKLLKEIPNAKLYIKGDESLNATIRVAHIWGKSFYEMGFLTG
jgi:hypothetical protein